MGRNRDKKADCDGTDMAPRVSSGSRADLRTALLVGCLGFLFYLPFNHGHFTGSDEIGVFETALSMTQDGDLTVPRIHNAFKGPNGKRYSQYAIGQSVLAVPFLGLAKAAEKTLPPDWLRALAGPQIAYRELRWGGRESIRCHSTRGRARGCVPFRCAGCRS